MSRNSVHVGLPLAAVLAAVLLVAPARAEEAPVWVLTPYRVQVLVAVASQPEFSPAWQDDLRNQLAARIENLVGSRWQATLASAPEELRQKVLDDLEHLEPQHLPAGEGDKLLLLAVAKSASGYTAAARDYDLRTQTLGATVRRRVPQSGKLADAALRALVAAFAPLALVQQVQEEAVTLRVRGWGLALRDPQIALLAPGSTLRPVVRYNRPDGSLDRLVAIGRTVLTVQSLDAEQAQARLQAGVPLNLTGTRGRHSESLAVAVAGPPDEPDAAPAEPPASENRRLALEAQLTGWCDRLTDLVTLRSLLLAQGRRQVESKQWDEARRTLAELEKLTSQEQFLEGLSAEGAKAAAAAAAEPAAQRQVEALLAEIKGWAMKHLDPQPIRELAAEVKAKE